MADIIECGCCGCCNCPCDCPTGCECRCGCAEAEGEHSIAEAVEVVARYFVGKAVEAAISAGCAGWEDLPLLGEHDYAAVQERTEAMARDLAPPDLVFGAAYKRLADRAEHVEPG